MNGAELRKLAASPEAFRSALLIPAGTGTRRLADVMADFQRRDFAALDVGFMALADGKAPPTHSRYWLERTKGASKDTDLAVMLLWLLAFTKRPLTCQVGAADQSQADELRKAARDIVRLDPWLAKGVEIQANAIIGHTGSRADILTSDSAGSHGARPHLVIINELTHTSKREFAETLMDNAAKVPGGVVVIATNAGHTGTWQEQWRHNARQSERWYFAALDKPAPWLDASELSEARRRNSINRYARLWLGQWVGETGTAFTDDDITAAIKLDGPIVKPERGWRYVASLDLGLKRDHTALAVIGRHVGYVERAPAGTEHPYVDTATRAAVELGLLPAKVASVKAEPIVSHVQGTGRMRLAELRSWRPEAGRPVKIEQVEQAIVELHAKLGLAAVAFDPWQAQYLAERLRKLGIRTVAVDFTAANLKAMASETLEAFRERNVEIYGDDELIEDLRKLQITERSYGFRLESPRTEEGHGDRATALAIGLFAAKRYATVAAGVRRQIRCYTQADMNN